MSKRPKTRQRKCRDHIISLALLAAEYSAWENLEGKSWFNFTLGWLCPIDFILYIFWQEYLQLSPRVAFNCGFVTTFPTCVGGVKREYKRSRRQLFFFFSKKMALFSRETLWSFHLQWLLRIFGTLYSKKKSKYKRILTTNFSSLILGFEDGYLGTGSAHDKECWWDWVCKMTVSFSSSAPSLVSQVPRILPPNSLSLSVF